MTFLSRFTLSARPAMLAGAAALAMVLATEPAQAQFSAFRQAVAEAAYSDDAVAAFYRANGYRAVWTADDAVGQARRAALIGALSSTGVHGLPSADGVVADLTAQMGAARSTRDLGMVEVALARAFLDYARDIRTGLLVPGQIDKGIARDKPVMDEQQVLTGVAGDDPAAYFRALAPDTDQYRGLMKVKLQLEQLAAAGGWGATVPSGKLEPGDSGPRVVALRDRLVRMGFMQPTADGSYGATMEQAVRQFQAAHGLEPDGVAGKGTLDEINTPVEDRLKSVIVAMERERWLNIERGDRHILVNQTDFTARIIDHGAVTFETRSVIGKNTSDRRSPEFSDEMEHMVINPSWYVPRSIVTKEYLPQLINNPNAAGHIEITDSRGRRVNRANMDFSQFSARSFPFAMRQPPGKSNALGLVKFMFPNKHNIYLHDTPQKHLFKREVRAFSHGCIRLAQPFDFAYTLLAAQTDDPKGYFHSVLNTGQETKVLLKQKVPVHIIYRTAFVTTEGAAEFRRDIYQRDAKIWDALAREGVALSAVRG